MSHLRNTSLAGIVIVLTAAMLSVLIEPSNGVGAASEQPQVVAQRPTSPQVPAVAMIREPVRITVARIGIDQPLHIKTPDRVSKSWLVDDDNAGVMAEFARPDSAQGATVVYGHARSAIFSNLDKAEIGDTLTVTFSDNSTKSYMLMETDSTEATDLSILKDAAAGEPRLILMTCTGTDYHQRLIAVFVPLDIASL